MVFSLPTNAINASATPLVGTGASITISSSALSLSPSPTGSGISSSSSSNLCGKNNENSSGGQDSVTSRGSMEDTDTTSSSSNSVSATNAVSSAATMREKPSILQQQQQQREVGGEDAVEQQLDSCINLISSWDSYHCDNTTTAAEAASSLASPSSTCSSSSSTSIKHRTVGADSVFCEHFLPDNLASSLLDEILEQVSWSEIRHKGKPLSRLVCIQGETVTIQQHEQQQQHQNSHGQHQHHHHHGSKHVHDKKKTTTTTTIYHPLYRNSADPQPTLESWSPAVRKLRDAVAASIRANNADNQQPHDVVERQDEELEDCCFLNHAVLQLYHSDDRRLVSEQADKTLDVVANNKSKTTAVVVHVSLGAARTLTLRPKRQGPNGERRPTPRPTTNIVMPHASYFALGCETNRTMTYEMRLNDNVAVPATTTHLQVPSSTIIASGSPSTSTSHSNLRISIAFRSVATFVSPATGQVFGRGARINKNMHRAPGATAGAHPIPRHVTSTIPLSIMSSSLSLPPPSSSSLSLLGSDNFSKDHHHHHDYDDRVGDSDTSDTASTTTLTTPSVSSCLVVDESSLCRQAKELLHAWSRENRCEDFDWDKVYGKGFDVVHVHAAMFGGQGSSSSSDNDNDVAKTPTTTMASSTCTSSMSIQKRSGNKRMMPKAADTAAANLVGKGDHGTANVQDASNGVAARESNKVQFHQQHGDESCVTRTAADSSACSSPTSVIKNISSLSPPHSMACPTAPITVSKMKSDDCVAGGGVALLAIDLQNDFLSDGPDFYLSWLGSPISPSRHQLLLKHVDDLACQVRSAGGVVVFVKTLSTSSAPFCAVGTLGSELHKDAAALIKQDPGEVGNDRNNGFVAHGDLILTKSWYSAFMGTTLHAQFQRMGIRHLVVCGVTTNHSVAATVRAAANKGYNVLLSSEGTAQIDPKLQCVTEKVLEPFCMAILKSPMKISDIISPSPILHHLHHQSRKHVRDKKEESEIVKNGSHTKDVLVFDGFDQLSGIGTGDSLYFPDLLSNGEAENLLDKLLPASVKGSPTGAHHGCEVDWKPLRFGDQGYRTSGGSLPRLVACQASVKDDGHVPIYRSADPEQIPRQNMHEEEAERTARWTPSLDIVRAVVEGRSGHSFNWGKLLCYRDGKGDTFLQADTCLDIAENSFLAIFSLGQERDLELLPKEEGARRANLAPQRISLRHNSLLLLGPQTSRMFLQFLRDHDNGTGKMVVAPSPTTKPRISITFRSVATMYVHDGEYPAFYGQGTEYEHFPQLQKARVYLSRRERRTGTALAAGVASLMALATGASRSSRMDSLVLDSGSGSSRTAMSSLKACAMATMTVTSSYWRKESRRDHLQQQEQDRRLAHVHRECRHRSVTASQARVMMMLPAWSLAKGEQAMQFAPKTRTITQSESSRIE